MLLDRTAAVHVPQSDNSALATGCFPQDVNKDQRKGGDSPSEVLLRSSEQQG